MTDAAGTANRLAVVTTGRQDIGILGSCIRALQTDTRFDTSVWAGGMHLDPSHGVPLALLEEAGVGKARALEFLSDPPDPANDAARAIVAASVALREDRPDAIVLLGDRTETLAIAFAAVMAGTPIIHLHGGEETVGAIDNACRHAITKLSHLHLVSHPEHAARVRQMGEDPACVVVVGAPGLDNMYRNDLPTRSEVAKSLGRSLPDPIVLVTMHPTTLGGEPLEEVSALAAALDRIPATYVITAPNSDAGGATIRQFWERWVAGRANAVFVSALGERRYWALLRDARAVAGNSSSGVIEAPAAGLAVVNVGDRQQGRIRFGRITDVPADANAIHAALEETLASGRPSQEAAAGYPAGPAAPRIVEAIARWMPTRSPRKAFHALQ